MAIFIVNRRTSSAAIQQRYGDVQILDVTSQGTNPWIRFSPFYPHGDVPVPFSPGYVSASVEGIWQGLKVFEQADVDPKRFAVRERNVRLSICSDVRAPISGPSTRFGRAIK